MYEVFYISIFYDYFGILINVYVYTYQVYLKLVSLYS